MDPVTITILGIVYEVSGLVLLALGTVFGILTTIVASKWGALVRFRFDKSSEKVVGVFGASGHGKTNLLLYLRGKPFRKSHIKTYGTKTYTGRKNSNKWRKMASFFTDVDGAEIKWYEKHINKYNPEGIIFVVDPQSVEKSKNAFENLVSVYDSVFLGEDRKVSLKVLLLLLTKSDTWIERNDMYSEEEKQKMEKMVQDTFSNKLEGLKCIVGNELTVQIDSSSFKERTRNPYKDSLISALNSFKTDLRD